jgi:hypothetical protein
MKIVGTDFDLTGTVNVDITGAQSVQFGYLKPGSSVIAYWTATVLDALTGAIKYHVTAAQSDTPGIWKAWPKVVQSDGKVVKTIARTFELKAEGTAYTA